MSFNKTVVLCLFTIISTALTAMAQEPPPQQSRISSPVRPAGTDPAFAVPTKAQVTIPGVPFYLWRHGCGPTAVGMIIGYWDGQGYDDLIPGDASVESEAVDQAMASGGDRSYGQDLPWPAGSEHHYEDYARPLDLTEPLLTDDCITASRMPHPDDCVADFMRTSRSSAGNYYGWSWSSDVSPAFRDYVALVAPYYQTGVVGYSMSFTLTLDAVKNEIDNGRPMVFLVDSDGDGATDHFITVVGYDDSNPADPQYLFHDTWDTRVHSAAFLPTMYGRQWGIWGGWSFSITGSRPRIIGNLRLELADPLDLTVIGAPAGATYQWERGTAEDAMEPIFGETAVTYAVDAATKDNAGWYRCLVANGSKAAVYTDSVHVEVFDQVPATGLAAFVAGALGVLAVGVRQMRRRW